MGGSRDRWVVVGVVVLLLGACQSSDSSSVIETHPTAVGTAPATTLRGRDLTLPGVIPEHGLAYRTPSGTAIATSDGEVLFTVPGVHVVDRSRDTSTVAAIITFDGDNSATPAEYALVMGSDQMQPAAPTKAGSPWAYGWTSEGAPDGCVRDGRRAGSDLLLCTNDPNAGPTRLARYDGGIVRDINISAIQPEGSWADAVNGPNGFIAATWSGECESLSAYLIGPDGEATPLGEIGGSAVLGWSDNAVLVARFGACGADTEPPDVVRISTTGATALVSTPGIIEAPVVW